MRTCAHCSLPVAGTAHSLLPATAPAFCCVGCRFAFQLGRPGASVGEATATGTLVLRLGAGIFVALNVMVFSWIFYSREIFGSAAGGPTRDALAELFSWLLLFLCSIVLVTLGFPLAHAALENLGRSRPFRPDTNLLICIGVGAAFLLSAVHTVRGGGRLYYDTAAVILVVVTLGHWLEAGARRRASASARALLADLPRQAVVRRDGTPVTVDVLDLRCGDVVAARCGETVVADGLVVEGASHLDESRLTGEFRPRPVAPGETVLAGSINLDGALWLRADAVGPERVVATMERMLEEARTRQAPLQRVADRVAAWFVPVVVVIALTVLVARAAAGDPARGLFDALSVLLIGCPCALGLATPLAAWHALRLAARRGILVDSAATLERAASVRRVLFDKTGTLTTPTLALAETRATAPLAAREALGLAAALELTSLHPIAGALVAAAREARITVRPATSPESLPGLGVEGTVGGRRLCLGGARHLARHGLTPGRAAGLGADDATLDSAVSRDDGIDDGCLHVFLFDRDGVLARFRLNEALRPEARATVAALCDLGLAAGILTGDAAAPARAVGAALGIDARSGLLPADKVTLLEALRRDGAVAMVGDGVNDAPVLAAADVGIAAGSATDLARQAGNVHLVADSLERVPELFAIARRAVFRMRLGLAWAFGYNAIGIGLAAAGLLSPVFAASAMFVSSLVVLFVARGAGRPLDDSGPGAAAEVRRADGRDLGAERRFAGHRTPAPTVPS